MTLEPGQRSDRQGAGLLLLLAWENLSFGEAGDIVDGDVLIEELRSPAVSTASSGQQG
jgi:hypothetical protein